jgi:hypothetical protein
MVFSQIRQFLDFGAEFVSRFLKDHAKVTFGPSINFEQGQRAWHNSVLEDSRST